MPGKHQAAFEKTKLRRAIQKDGAPYVFKRYPEDHYKEPSDDPVQVLELEGIFHTVTKYISVQVGDGGQVQSKSIPMILCMCEDTAGLEKDDFVEINGQKYKVNEVDNVNEFGIAAEISLELEK